MDYLVEIAMKEGGLYVHLMKIQVLLSTVPEKEAKSCQATSGSKCVMEVQTLNLKKSPNAQPCFFLKKVAVGICLFPEHPSSAEKSKVTCSSDLLQDPMPF
ncbi:hypothetical protein O181_013500 [Austropuccinia psidii MF-1]|uniref:Uncharacterized protein n=1 Tax=Austropuccinia psidii MF-1 TaxID=1389203 RepID=A0A9Q3GNZ8_9BASI|nr:hypothetical protein [Austropuccinia psidii MF-1]